MFFANNLTYWLLLSFGVHVGHSILNSHMYSAWLIFVYTLKIAYINLYKSVLLARIGFLALSAACMNYSPIWFINLDYVNRHYAKNAANSCGEYSWIGKWVHGALSNYETVGPLILKLLRMSHHWHNARQRWHQGGVQYWITSRHSYPRAVFTPSVHESYSPVSEAFFSNIPCFGVADTNAHTNTVSIAFPGNDDSLDCLSLYHELAVNYIMTKKLKIVLYWFTFVRDFKAIIRTSLNETSFLDTVYSHRYFSHDVKNKFYLWQHHFNHWINIPKYTLGIESFGATFIYQKMDSEVLKYPWIDTVASNNILFDKFDQKLFQEKFFNSLDIIQHFYFNNMEIFNKILYFSINFWYNTGAVRFIEQQISFYHTNLFYFKNYWANCFIEDRAKRSKMRGSINARSPYRSSYQWVDRDAAKQLKISINNQFIIYRVVLECAYNNNLSNLTMANMGSLTYNYNIYKFFGLTDCQEFSKKNILSFTFSKALNSVAKGINGLNKLHSESKVVGRINGLIPAFSNDYDYVWFYYKDMFYFVLKKDLYKIRKNTASLVQIITYTYKSFLYYNSSLQLHYKLSDVVEEIFILIEYLPPKITMVNLYDNESDEDFSLARKLLRVGNLFLSTFVAPKIFRVATNLKKRLVMNSNQKFLKSLILGKKSKRDIHLYSSPQRINNFIISKHIVYSYNNFLSLVYSSSSLLFKGRLGGAQYSNNQEYWNNVYSRNSLQYFFKYNFFYTKVEQQKLGYMPVWSRKQLFRRCFTKSNSKRVVVKSIKSKYCFNGYNTINPSILKSIARMHPIVKLKRDMSAKFFKNKMLNNFTLKKPYILNCKGNKKKKIMYKLYNRIYRNNKYLYFSNRWYNKMYNKIVINKFVNKYIRLQKKLFFANIFMDIKYYFFLKMVKDINFFVVIKKFKFFNNILILLLSSRLNIVKNNNIIRMEKNISYFQLYFLPFFVTSLIDKKHVDLSIHFDIINKCIDRYENMCKKTNRTEWWNIENVARWRFRQLRKKRRWEKFKKFRHATTS